MWVFTTDGFFSAVEHWDDEALVMIRARDKHDLLHLRMTLTSLHPKHRDVQIEHTPTGDYEWRLTVSKASWANYLTEAALEIDYYNFKDAVKFKQGTERANIYMGVWSVMRRLQDGVDWMTLATRRVLDRHLFDDDDYDIVPLEQV